MSQPGFFFYTGDWLKDTRVLTAAVRGAWIDLLCVLHEHGGEIRWSLDDLAQFWTVERREGDAFVRDLSRLKIADVTLESQDMVTIICRRMKRVALGKEHAKLRKQRERDRKGKYRGSHGSVTSMSTLPSSSESSSSLNLHLKKDEDQEPATPEPSAEPANAGKKELDPQIKKAADKVYLTDPVKFRRLIVWIKEAEKYSYAPVVIAAALERFAPYAADITDWYPYLDKIIEKADKDINRDRHEAEHNRQKEETREASKITNLRNWVKDA